MQSAVPTMRHGCLSWASTMRPDAFGQRRETWSGTVFRRTLWEGIDTSSPLRRFGGCMDGRSSTPIFGDGSGGPAGCLGPFLDGISIVINGLDLEVVRILGETIRPKRSEDLAAIEPEDRSDVSREVEGGEFLGSVFSDGSRLGEVTIPRVRRPDIEWIGVEL